LKENSRIITLEKKIVSLQKDDSESASDKKIALPQNEKDIIPYLNERSGLYNK